MKPVRKIHNRSPHKVIGRFPSNKSRFCIWWESQLEQDCLFHLEFDREVAAISGQPFHVSYVLNGKRRRYTPDFLVEGSNLRDVIEVKPLAKTLTPEFRLWKAAVTEVLARHKYRFFIKTELDLRREPELSNLKWLYRFLRTEATDYQCQQLLAQIQRGARTVGAVQAHARVHNSDVELVWHLIATRAVEVDLNQRLTEQSLISSRSNA
ncbi:MAG: TnsA endonuclease C-terminal domain-containing protein [Betaproteobacteria bacterium]|nr:TnsA endonuclease C-terminal domain-containing protein [Betaproteobacteria bacterium]